MKVNREQLIRELEMVSPGLSPREIIEQSSCFVFSEGFVMTFNDDIACKCESSLNSITGAVQAAPLLSILNKFKEEEIVINSLKTDDGFEFIIEGKRRKAGIRMEQDILLPIESVESPKKWKKIAVNFVDAISIVKDCASRDESQFCLTCIHVHPEYIETCDGFQAARYKVKNDVKKPFLIRKDSIKTITNLAITQFSESKNWTHFRNEHGLILSCRRYLEEFPNLDKVLKGSGTPLIIPKGVKEAAEKASVFSTENIDDDSVTVSIKKNKIKIKGKGMNGWFIETKKIKYSEKPLEFNISPALLIQLIDRHNECQISKKKLMVNGKIFVYATSLGTC